MSDININGDINVKANISISKDVAKTSNAGKDREEYFDLMGFKRGSKEHCRALQRAHEVRQFEINLYWERNKYAYLIVGAIFLGVFSEKVVGQETLLQLFLSFVGMIVAFAWVLINKGSKFWLENWESHIDMLEDEFEGNLYKVVDTVDFEKNAWSVSKTNIHLSIFIFFCFSALFTIFFFQKIPPNCIKILVTNIYPFNFGVFWDTDYVFLLLGVLASITAVIFIFNVVFARFKLILSRLTLKVRGYYKYEFARFKLTLSRLTACMRDYWTVVFAKLKLGSSRIPILLKLMVAILKLVVAILKLMVAILKLMVAILKLMVAILKLMVAILKLKFLRPKLDTKKDTTEKYDHEFTIRDRKYTLTEKAKDSSKYK